MMNVSNDVLMAYVSKYGKKGGDLKASSDGFEALLAMLMNQGMVAQESGITGLQGDLSGQFAGVLGVSTEGLNSSDAFGVIQIMQRMMSDLKVDEGSASGINELMKGLLDASVQGNNTLNSGNPQLDQMMKALVREVSGDLNGKLNDQGLKSNEVKAAVNTSNTNASVQEIVNAAAIKVQDEPTANSALNGTDSSKNASAGQVIDNAKNADSNVNNPVVSEVEQYIVQRPEIFKILKGENTKASAESSSASVQKSSEINVDKLQGIKSDDKKSSDSITEQPKEKRSSWSDDSASNVLQPSVENKSFQVGKLHDVSTSMKELVQTNKNDILNQIFDKVKVINDKDISELHINLKPDSLGEVTIKLVMEKGIMTGRIMVENNHVRNLIESSLPQIKENLKNQNLDVVSFNVSVAAGQGDLSYNQNFSMGKWAFNKKGFAGRADNTVKVEEIRPNQAAIPRGVLNMLV